MPIETFNIASLSPDTQLIRRIRVEPGNNIPLHEQIRVGLMKVIEEHFNEEDVFFTEKALIENLPVSQITVGRALRDLQRDGILRRERGRGTTVARRSHQGSSSLNSSALSPAAVTSIGLLVFSYESDYVSAMVSHLALACKNRHIDFQTHYCGEGDRLPNILDLLTTTPQDQAIVTLLPHNLAPNMHDLLDARGLRNVALEGMGNTRQSGSVVATDSRAAIRIGMEHLVQLGHQRIALLVNEPLTDQSVLDKLDEFHRMIRGNDDSRSLFPVLCETRLGQNSFDSAYRHMPDVWDVRPTAIFAVSDPGAWAAMRWLTENGIDIPADVSVLGFEDARSSKFLHPALSSVAHPLAERASRVVEILTNPLLTTPVQEKIMPYLVVRESTGKVKL